MLQADAVLAELKDDVNTTKTQLMVTDADVKQALTTVNTTLTQRVSIKVN